MLSKACKQLLFANTTHPLAFQRSFGMPKSPLAQERTIEAASGYSIGPVLRMRITLPDQGVANVQKKGRSIPFSLYSSMTCASTPASQGMQP